MKDAFEEALKKRSMGAPALTITIGGPAPEMEVEEELPMKEEKKKDSRELGLAPDIELEKKDASDDGEEEEQEPVDEGMEMARLLQGPESDEEIMSSMEDRKPRSLGEHLKLKMAQIKK